MLGFSPAFSLILLNLKENRYGTRKGIKFWIERLIINSAWELGFRRKSQKLKSPFRDFPGGP